MSHKELFLYNPVVDEQLKQIRKTLYLRMNGDVASFIAKTEDGANYKLVYGALLPELKTLAKRFTPNKQLAECLWNSRIREMMILAALLYPPEEFLPETANAWMASMPTVEMAEICSMVLFSKLPYAETLTIAWVNHTLLLGRLSAWLLLTRIASTLFVEVLESYAALAVDAIPSEEATVQHTMFVALQKMKQLLSETVFDRAVSRWKRDDATQRFYLLLMQD